METYGNRVLNPDERRAIATSGCNVKDCKIRAYWCVGEWQVRAGAAGMKMPCGGSARAAGDSRIVVVDKKPVIQS